jgi:hypothetical protein
MTTASAIETMVTEMLAGPFSGCNGAGEPMRRYRKVVNGIMVTAYTFGLDDRVVIETSVTGTKPLTIAEAAEVAS